MESRDDNNAWPMLIHFIVFLLGFMACMSQAIEPLGSEWMILLLGAACIVSGGVGMLKSAGHSKLKG